MTRILLFSIFLFMSMGMEVKENAKNSGNPLFKGWYADPEARIFGKTYWIYPTYSDKYEKQVFFDAFSSTDLVQVDKALKNFRYLFN